MFAGKECEELKNLNMKSTELNPLLLRRMRINGI